MASLCMKSSTLTTINTSIIELCDVDKMYQRKMYVILKLIAFLRNVPTIMFLDTPKIKITIILSQKYTVFIREIYVSNGWYIL